MMIVAITESPVVGGGRSLAFFPQRPSTTGDFALWSVDDLLNSIALSAYFRWSHESA